MSRFCLTLQRNDSWERAKRSSDRGHPCRVPFEIGKGSDRNPFALICAVVFDYTLEIHPTILSPSPTYYKTENIKDQLTQSNTFAVSVPKNTEGVLKESARWIRFKALMVLSRAS